MGRIYQFGLLGIGFIASLIMTQPRAIAGVAMEGTMHEKAIFAGGCFWSMEKAFEQLPGVISVTAGYTGGDSVDPNYENYMQGGHVEAVEVAYDPVKIAYPILLNVFWRQVNPTDAGGQFVDRGSQYTTAIFYRDEKQKSEAEASKAALAESGRFDAPIVTPIKPAKTFYPAETYHQDFYKKNPVRYHSYRSHSGRDQFFEKVWDEEDRQAAREEALKKRLTPLQFEVTQEDGTERPFHNAYWNNKEAGIYVDIVSGKPLFSSLDKFDSGTGWPSFTRPLVAANIVEKSDHSFGMLRTEVRSAEADSHLGHLFTDGPAPTGMRYCINSAALRFIPAKDLEKEGYGQFLPLFEERKQAH